MSESGRPGVQAPSPWEIPPPREFSPSWDACPSREVPPSWELPRSRELPGSRELSRSREVRGSRELPRSREVPSSADVFAASGDPDWLPREINTGVAHSARVYDYWLGGKDNFTADRALGDAVTDAIPTIRAMARANRDFLGRAVRYLVGQAGVTQFLDIGTGIPAAGNVHEVAQAIEPASRVVYTDNDPIVLAHARALMTSHPAGAIGFIDADLREPQMIMEDPAVRATLDLGKPVALMLVAILMLISDDENPWRMVSALLDALPSGSYLTITHPSADFNPGEMAGAVAAAQQAGITMVPRGRACVETFFTGLELIDPGVVPVLAWRPDGPPRDPREAYIYAAMARKP